MDMKKVVPIMVIGLLLVGGGGFYAGMKYGLSKQQTNFSNFAQRSGMPGGMGPGAGGQTGSIRQGGKTGQNAMSFVNGELISKDETSMTLKLQDGGSKLVYFSTSTQVMKSSEGTINDLVVGQNLMINGKSNQDGSVTAQTVQMRPEMPELPMPQVGN